MIEHDGEPATSGPSPCRVLVVAGEASGDRHAAAVIARLHESIDRVESRGMGGPSLASVGAHLDVDLRRTTAMGGVELLARIHRIGGAWARMLSVATRWRPDVALLVDLPEFNIPLGKRLRRAGIPVVGYVAPQVWAWRPGRARDLSSAFDHVACVLPFEAGTLRAAGVRATFVGHPLIDQDRMDRGEARHEVGLRSDTTCLALLPGSRPAEVARHLPPMLEAAVRLRRRHGIEAVMALAPSLVHRPDVPSWVRVVSWPRFDQPGAAALAVADAALVASGTATLEAALAGVPQVAVCRLSTATCVLARIVVRCRYFALPNLILGRRLVPELLQGSATGGGMGDHIAAILDRPRLADAQREARGEIVRRLEGPGAARTVADLVAGLAAS
jgi:lipid-A-disaccharide synthase